MQKSKQLSQENEGMVADGFSSEEQVYTKKNLSDQQNKDQRNQQQLNEKVKFILPPPQQIKSKAYSLQPDKATGWGIKTEQPNPIPITFANRYLDNLVNQMLASDSKQYTVVYLGPRYENTFYAYRDKPFKFPYSHINMAKNIKYKKRPFLGQNPQVQKTIYFDSIFQSGNLDLAVKVNSHEYDLFARVDSNTRGHFNWFSFVVAGLIPNEKYRFNICNLQRGFCLYTRGMRPYMKSLKKKGDCWRQDGLNVTYSRKQIRFARHYNFQYFQSYQRPIKSWNLTFDIQTTQQNDQIHIAYCVPYTYSHMLKVVQQFKEQYDRKNIIKETILCMSLGGLPIPLLTITEPQKTQNQQAKVKYDDKSKQKKCIMICGRVHPGESNGSFMMEGFLKFICGGSMQAKMLRKYIVFKIVPMLNPDGVVLGNYRTGLSGRDFNREYRNPDKDIFPQVYFFKKLVTEMKLQYKSNLFMFLDLHGHSTKKNVFAYGPQFPITEKYYYQSRIFAKMLEKQNSMFRYHSCVFKVSECKLATARAILLRKINVPLTYTIEASNGFYHDKEKLVSVPFVAQEWIKMGSSIGKAIWEYLECTLTGQKARQQRQKAKNQALKAKREKSSSKFNSLSPIKKQSTNNLISAKEDARILKIYEQILMQQKQGPQDANSDDNISEGSSDKEDDKDDLSKKQLETLFSSIKNNNKLGKNKAKKGKGKDKLNLDLNELENEDEDERQKVDQMNVSSQKVRFRIKNIELFDNRSTINAMDSSDQVFILDRNGTLGNNQMSTKKHFGIPKYLNERKQRNLYHFGRPDQISTTTKIINYKFQEQPNRSQHLETISILPSFTMKNKNTIILTERGQGQRSIMISNHGNSPRQIKLLKGRDFDRGNIKETNKGTAKQTNRETAIEIDRGIIKDLDKIVGVRHKNQFQKKLEHIAYDTRVQKSYNKFNRTGIFTSRQHKNSSFSFASPFVTRNNLLK